MKLIKSELFYLTLLYPFAGVLVSYLITQQIYSGCFCKNLESDLFKMIKRERDFEGEQKIQKKKQKSYFC